MLVPAEFGILEKYLFYVGVSDGRVLLDFLTVMKFKASSS